MGIFVTLIWIGSGISFFAALQFTLFWIFRRQESVFLAFGVLCLLLSAYMVFSAQWYHAESIVEVAAIARYQMAIVCVVYPVFVWFLGRYTHDHGLMRVLLPVSLVFAVLFLINLFSPYSFLYQDMVIDAPIRLPWGEVVGDYKKTIAPIAWLYYAATYSVFIWSFVRCAAIWKRNQPMRAISIFVYLVAQLAVIVHAELIDNLGLRSVYFGEFAFLVLVVLVSACLAKEVGLRSNALERSVKDLREETDRRKEYENQLIYMAHNDYLTDLPNRRAMYRQLEEVQARQAQRHAYGAMLLIDVDNFKLINDSLGHDTGDQLLVMIALRLKDCLSDGQVAIRLGGDEFAILCGGLADEQRAARQRAVEIAKSIRSGIIDPYRIAEHELVISFCVGIAIFGDHTQNLSDILKQADMALYRAKSAGPGNIKVFAPDLKRLADRRLVLEKDMRTAIDNGEIDVEFQPQVDVEGTIAGAEVLARWRHPNLGNVPPGEFIVVAEESGVIHALGESVLFKACQCLRNWEANNLVIPPRLSVNVSPWQLDGSGFATMVTRVLNETGVAPQRLNLEVTESTFMREFKKISAKMNELGMLGITFSIDDFGTGYSALGWLKRLPLHELKIDRMFIHDMALLQHDKLIETILAIAEQMDLRAVAEGVETAAQRDALEKMGCRYFQGFLISPSLPESEFVHWLQLQHGLTASAPAQVRE
jgi:diguanylate cyclase (GGDEF)-like protein